MQVDDTNRSRAPAKVAPNEPNIEMKLMIIGKLGYIEKRKSEIEQVARIKRMQTIIIENKLELKLKSKILNISILAKIAMQEKIITKGISFPNIILMNLPFAIDKQSLIFLLSLKSLPKEYAMLSKIKIWKSTQK